MYLGQVVNNNNR